MPNLTELAKRVALVIGNSNYEHAGWLGNPRNDAEALAASLRKIGFQVASYLDLDLKGFRTALQDFGECSQRARWIELCYANSWVLPFRYGASDCAK